MCAPRGNPKLGGKCRQQNTATACEDHEPAAHLQHLVNDTNLINNINDSIAAFIQRNVSYEVQKAIAINVMVTALQN